MSVRDIAILLFDDVEILDFAGPYEVFSVAGRLVEPSPFRVFTVAEAEVIKTRGGLRVMPDYVLTKCPQPDILLVPGGWGTRSLMDNRRLLGWIAAQAALVEQLLSVCTGALLLARAGLLDGLHVTTHHSAIARLKSEAPGALVYEDRRFLDNGKIVVAGGISAGLDMSLQVVAKLIGVEHARATAAHMEYLWVEDGD